MFKLRLLLLITFLFFGALSCLDENVSAELELKARQRANDIAAEEKAREERFLARQKAIQAETQRKQRDINTKTIFKLNDQVFSFLEKASPELLKQLALIKAQVEKIQKDDLKLQQLLINFPDQSQLINKRLKVMFEMERVLTDSFQKIVADVRAAYVTYKIDEISGKKSFAKTKEQLISKAKESIKFAKDLKDSLQEITEHK